MSTQQLRRTGNTLDTISVPAMHGTRCSCECVTDKPRNAQRLPPLSHKPLTMLGPFASVCCCKKTWASPGSRRNQTTPSSRQIVTRSAAAGPTRRVESTKSSQLRGMAVALKVLLRLADRWSACTLPRLTDSVHRLSPTPIFSPDLPVNARDIPWPNHRNRHL
jgi:hypothetical protein